MAFTSFLLPRTIDNTTHGPRFAVWIFTLLAIVSAVRSCIHIFSPDGGASSIAGMDLSVPGASGIVFSFALWGSSQLLFAFVQLAAAFRYRSLIPVLWVLFSVEAALRMLVARMKPVTFSHMPPGGYANWIGLPLGLIMVLLMWRTSERR